MIDFYNMSQMVKMFRDCQYILFFYQPEASFTIRPYLEKMTHSELHAIMTAGFASVTADVFGLFVVYGVSIPDCIDIIT